MTRYIDLDEDEQEEIDKDLMHETYLIQQAVLDGHYCACCFMVYYNCLCSHDD